MSASRIGFAKFSQSALSGLLSRCKASSTRQSRFGSRLWIRLMVLLPRSVQSQQKPSSPAFGAKRSTSTPRAPSARSGVWAGKTKIMGDSQMSDQKRVKIKYKPRQISLERSDNRKQRWSVLVLHLSLATMPAKRWPR